MKKITMLACLLAIGSAAFAQNPQSLGEAELQELKGSYNVDGESKSLHNIIRTTNSLKTLAYNPDLAGQTDDFFKYEVNVKGITDQLRSGRCWMFTSMNELRPLVMKKYNIGSFDFSHNYSYFWDILEKSNLFLENIIRTADREMDDREVCFYFSSPVGDGGVWNLFYNIATKYGVVPDKVMPETVHSNSTSQLLSIVNERLRKGGYEIREARNAWMKRTKKVSGVEGTLAYTLKQEKMKTLKDVYRVLSICLGTPPTEFTWKFKDNDGKIQTVKSTPVEFFRGIIPEGYDPDNYVMIMNDPTREYYKIYEIQNYRNSIEGINWTYLNLPNDVIKAAALKSIQAGEPMYTSSDVGKYSNTASGIGYMDPALYDYNSLLGVDLSMEKKARIITRQSGSSHAMLLIACDTDDNGNYLKWRLENSWGASAGRHGYLNFSDTWFNEYIFRIVINKKYLDSKTLESLGQKHVMLPPWDYMF